MVIATPHRKSQNTLASMSMKSLLKLVKDHHLAQHLGVYKRMNKADLITALGRYEKSTPSKMAKAKAVAPTTAPAAPKKPAASKRRTPSHMNITNKAPKRRIKPTVVKSTSGEPFASKGPKGVTTYGNAVRKIEKKAAAMDASSKGKKLISNTPVRRSARIKTINNYRTGRAY